MTSVENSLSLTMAVSDGRLRPSDAQKDLIGIFLAQRNDQQVTVQISRPKKTRSGNQKQRELHGDCDFYVGRNHTTWTTTTQAIKATVDHLGDSVFGGTPWNKSSK